MVVRILWKLPVTASMVGDSQVFTKLGSILTCLKPSMQVQFGRQCIKHDEMCYVWPKHPMDYAF